MAATRPTSRTCDSPNLTEGNGGRRDTYPNATYHTLPVAVGVPAAGGRDALHRQLRRGLRKAGFDYSLHTCRLRLVGPVPPVPSEGGSAANYSSGGLNPGNPSSGAVWGVLAHGLPPETIVSGGRVEVLSYLETPSQAAKGGSPANYSKGAPDPYQTSGSPSNRSDERGPPLSGVLTTLLGYGAPLRPS
jgi:hypothetical protein